MKTFCECGCGKETKGFRQFVRGHRLRRGNTIIGIMGRLIVQENGCCLWAGSFCYEGGYGVVAYKGKQVLVHRLLYEHFVGKVPDGLELDHFHCQNRSCCNFTHVEPVTKRENILRGNSPMAINARRTHCKSGHPFDDANTHITSTGRRLCRTCDKIRQQLKRDRIKGIQPATITHYPPINEVLGIKKSGGSE